MSDSLNEALERHGLTVAGQKRRGLRTYEGDEGALLRADDAGLIRSAARRYAAGTPLQWCETHDQHPAECSPTRGRGPGHSIVEQWRTDPPAEEEA